MILYHEKPLQYLSTISILIPNAETTKFHVLIANCKFHVLISCTDCHGGLCNMAIVTLEAGLKLKLLNPISRLSQKVLKVLREQQ